MVHIYIYRLSHSKIIGSSPVLVTLGLMYGGLINISPQHTLDLKEFCYFSIFCIILLSLSDNIVIHLLITIVIPRPCAMDYLWIS